MAWSFWRRFQVILSHATHLYLDMPIEPDPEERGLYWATRTTPMKTIFSYQPDNIYNNMDVDTMGNPLNRTEICAKFSCPELTKPENIVGQIRYLYYILGLFAER